jgi:hypothetical protein
MVQQRLIEHRIGQADVRNWVNTEQAQARPSRGAAAGRGAEREWHGTETDHDGDDE